jgi:hypothetical protein
VRLPAAENDLFDLLRGDLRHLAEHVADTVGREIIRPGDVEGSAMGLRQRCTAAGDDDGLSHEYLDDLDIF